VAEPCGEAGKDDRKTDPWRQQCELSNHRPPCTGCNRSNPIAIDGLLRDHASSMRPHVENE
jgi:hypothetical protein